MKESFGGLFIIRLMLVFFVIYVTFIGVALNIAKSYRIKNGVINILEQGKYSGGDMSGPNSNIGKKMDDYLEGIPYKVPAGRDAKIKEKYCNDAVYYDGVCIIPGSSNADANYYKVIVFMSAEFPFLDIDLTIPISGETMTIAKK